MGLVGRAAVSRPPSARRKLVPGTPRVAARTADGVSWLSQQAADVQSQTAAEELAAAAEAAAAEANARDDSKAHSVGLGLHIRGRAIFQEGATDENDPARLPYHKLLSRAAMTGSTATATAVLEDMANAGFIPGPRAYHALVYSWAKAGIDDGALSAIRKCWDAGITPLPETYAAVVAVHVAAGDLVTAEAVYASNRRAGVDCTKSWSQLVTAFFKTKQPERATELLSQGEAEGLQPSEAMYQYLMLYRCSQGVEAAMDVVPAMERHGVTPSLPIMQPLICKVAATGDPEIAYGYLAKLALPVSSELTSLCCVVLEALLRACHTLPEVVVQVGRIKALMRGATPGSAFYLAQLETTLRLNEPRASMQVFRNLVRRDDDAIKSLGEDLLGQLLIQLSHSCMPAELYEVLALMSRKRLGLPSCAMVPDENGCTVLGTWVKQRLDRAAFEHPEAGYEEEVQQPVQPAAVGTPAPSDEVLVDPLLLCVVDADGSTVPVSRMTVKELRAELAARRAPASGNKKDLSKRVQRLRLMDGTRGAASSSLQRSREDMKGSSSSKERSIITFTYYKNGRVVDERRESEFVEEALEDELEGPQDELLEAQEWDLMEEDGPSQRAAKEDDEEEAFDDEDDMALDGSGTSAEPQPTFILARSLPMPSPLAGPHEAAAIVLGVVKDLHAQPSAADLQAVFSYVLLRQNVPAAVLLAAALDCLPEPAQGAEQLRGQLATLCASRDVDVNAAIVSILQNEDATVEVATANHFELEELLADVGMD